MQPYIIFTAKNLYELATEVNNLIREGYKPLGGPFYTFDQSYATTHSGELPTPASSYVRWCQALHRE